MGKVEVKNLLFQPLTLARNEGGPGVHLGARERLTLADKDISSEMRRAARQGFISITPVVEETSVPAATEQQPPAPSAQQTKRRGGGE